MFLDFYKLREQPFGETPDPRYLYLSATHCEAMASLAYGIEVGRGFLVLVADPGLGKTTLLVRLLEWLRGSARTAFLFQTQCDSRELLCCLLSDLGISTQATEFVRMHEQLKQVLITEASVGRRLVIFIDEAQNLTESVLETVRLLSDYENPGSKLIQIVLAGQPQLADKLARPELAQLRQRVSILSRLNPFTPSETEAYISHRLFVAGSDGRQLFTPEARAMIAAWSRGVPRNINNLCFNALGLGFAMGKLEIDSAIIQEAARDLELSPNTSNPWDSRGCVSDLTLPRSAASRVAKIGSSKECSAGPTEPPPSSRQEFKAVATSTDHRSNQKTSVAMTRTHAWQRAMIFVGVGLIALFLVGETRTFLLHYVMAHLTIPNSAQTSRTSEANSQSEKRVRDSALAASPSESLLKVRKKSPASAVKVADDKSLASPAAVLRFTPDTIYQSTPPDVTGLSSDVPFDRLEGVLGRNSNIISVAPPISQANVPMHVSGRVREPHLASKVPPIYPPDAKHNGVEGEVVIDAVIDTNGKPTNLKVVSGPAALQGAALASVRHWQYEPSYVDDKPVPVEMLIPVEFRLHE